jgi:hypothetical protein
VQGLLIGMLGTSATFAPLVADTSRWFDRRRGIALAICMSGNYTAGAVWPPVMQYFIDTAAGADLTGHGRVLMPAWLPLALCCAPAAAQRAAPAGSPPGWRQPRRRPLGLPRMLQALLCVAGVSCCVAMSMPQGHIVPNCGDLGFGAARGAEMLSLMLGMGV